MPLNQTWDYSGIPQPDDNQAVVELLISQSFDVNTSATTWDQEGGSEVGKCRVKLLLERLTCDDDIKPCTANVRRSTQVHSSIELFYKSEGGHNTRNRLQKH